MTSMEHISHVPDTIKYDLKKLSNKVIKLQLNTKDQCLHHSKSLIKNEWT